MDWMDTEYGRSEPRSSHFEPPQEITNEQRIDDMQNNIEHMVAKRIQSPELEDEPESRKKKRIILRSHTGSEPYGAEPFLRAHHEIF